MQERITLYAIYIASIINIITIDITENLKIKTMI
jgi:hypothetical protein